MPLSPSSVLIGSHGYFWQDGQPFTLPAPGTTGRESHADASDPGWANRYLGIVGTCRIQSARGEGVEVWAPSPGQLRLHDVIASKSDIMVSFTLQQLTPLAFQLLFGTAALDSSSTQWNPTAGPGRVKGWLKFQAYNQDNVLVTVADLYSSVSVPEDVTLDPAALVEVTVEARLLTSSLNTGSL